MYITQKYHAKVKKKDETRYHSAQLFSMLYLLRKKRYENFLG